MGHSRLIRRCTGTCAALVMMAVMACAPDSEDASQMDPGLDLPVVASAAAATPQSPSTRASQEIEGDRANAIVRAASRVAPAVVSVSVIRTRRIRPRTLWESFYLPPGAQRRSAGFGSGVIVREDGIVLTNNHVVDGAAEIRVTLPSGVDADAVLVGSDPVSDIAVLRIEGSDLPVAPIGTVDGLMIGEWAIAIGNPLGNYVGDTQPTVTAGVVSAVNRNIAPSSREEGFYLGMIQTDASINPGNSGGPLVNAAGEVIGINASIISRSGGSEGLGFAIPIDRALRIANDLLRFGEVRRAWIGIEVEPLEADAWGRTRGVRISSVAPGSPGDLAALEPGDRLLSADGRALTGPLDFEGVLLDLRAGDVLALEVAGQPRIIELEAVAFPSTTAERITFLEDIELITVTPAIRAERGLTSESGALIAGISEELSRRLGLRSGDVILQVNRVPIRSAEELTTLFESFTGSGRVAIWFERNGAPGVRNLYWRRPPG